MVVRKIDVGDAIPHFVNEDQDKIKVTDLDIVGHPTVLFFYPTNTQSFSREMILNFQDHYKTFAKQEIVIIGIGLDSSKVQKAFCIEEHIAFSLLDDQELQTSHLFGVWGALEAPSGITEGIVPTVFLIDRDGIVQWVERNINLIGLMDRIFDAIRKFL